MLDRSLERSGHYPPPRPDPFPPPRPLPPALTPSPPPPNPPVALAEAAKEAEERSEEATEALVAAMAGEDVEKLQDAIAPTSAGAQGMTLPFFLFFWANGPKELKESHQLDGL